MARSEEEVREILESRFGGGLTACHDLLAFVDSQMADWKGRAVDHGADLIILAELARTLKTARAALMLCRQGYGEQAAMLSRSLFEGMAVAHWVHANPDEALDRFEKHGRHTALVFSDALVRQEWVEEWPVEVPPATDAERKHLVGMFGPYGERGWCTPGSLRKLVEAIADQWPDAASRAELRAYLDVPHRFHNKLLHATFTALNASARESAQADVSFVAGPSEQLVPNSLLSVHWTLGQTFSLIYDRFALPDRDAFDTRYGAARRAFIHLSAEDLRGVGRNDLCPCTSGLKFKRCHGA